MDLSLLTFTLETYRFCMKCIEFPTRTYNFKNLAVGSLIWSAKTGVNSSYFPQKFSNTNFRRIMVVRARHPDCVCTLARVDQRSTILLDLRERLFLRRIFLYQICYHRIFRSRITERLFRELER